MINRVGYEELNYLGKTFKAIAVIGPRQSGKTTLVKQVFKNKPYVSMENTDMRNFAEIDPRGFLANYPDGAILDEAQRVPHLFNYLQEILDDSKKKGMFILTGSNNFLFQESITQSLAGRIAYFTLLPFSVEELEGAGNEIGSDEELMLKGFFPPVYDQNLPSQKWSNSYIQSYIERDIRMIKNIDDLYQFEMFLKLLAGRCGQELNFESLSVEAGVSAKTVKSWLGILESGYIIHLLRPHHRNYNKTIVKRPKLYFIDTAIVCSLLGIENENHLKYHPLRGSIFENMVVMEMLKSRFHRGKKSDLFYWREKNKYEVDLIIEKADILMPVEIKSGKTINPDMFKNLLYWQKLTGTKPAWLLYGGDRTEKRSNGITATNWKNFPRSV